MCDKGPIRVFNHSTSVSCLDRLAHKSAANSNRSHYRILFTGVSNGNHVWHAMGADDRPKWDPWIDYGRKHPQCLATIPESRLTSFLPHVVDFSPWHVVSRTGFTDPVYASRAKLIYSSCFRVRSMCDHYSIDSGGRLEYITQHSAPYDAVVIYAGAWDASYTARNLTLFHEGMRRGVTHLLTAWSDVRVILFTVTPCGPVNNPRSKVEPPRTSVEGCAFAEPMNSVIRAVADEHAGRVQVLDAHQMILSRPDVNISGYPPGLWDRQQQAGWHFQQVITPEDRAKLRALQPPSAGGEINRAFANRVYDMLCP